MRRSGPARSPKTNARLSFDQRVPGSSPGALTRRVPRFARPQHGRAGAGSVKAKILVLDGADDPFVKREQYDVLKNDVDAAKADYRVIEYPGAVHAFTNPEATALGQKFNLPLRYDEKVDREAMAEALKLFNASLKQ